MSTPPTLLIVDDTKSNIDLLVEFLGDYGLLIALNGPDALEILATQSVDLVLLDVMMPLMDGYEVCERLKATPKTASIPVIFITAKNDEESIERAFDVGGSDYISKPFKPKELLARIRTHLKLQEAIQELTFLATRDTMTGLLNRRSFFTKAHALIETAHVTHTPLCAMMLDLDHFKSINDTYGHDVGDGVIRLFAQTARAFVADETEFLFARIGGEEFALLAQRTLQECVALAEQIRQAIASITQVETVDLTFSVSIGVAQLQEAETIDALLKRADEKLYSVKKGSRNAVSY